ncbi:hypothetical protein KAI87_06860 [Myxococcota bacterium]|nr:hypothetical protein [Myxococcota bacterium]
MARRLFILTLFLSSFGHSIPAFAAKNKVMVQVAVDKDLPDPSLALRSTFKKLRKKIQVIWPEGSKKQKSGALQSAMSLARDSGAVYLAFFEMKKLASSGAKKPWVLMQIMDVGSKQTLFTSQYPLEGRKQQLSNESRADLLSVLEFILLAPPPKPVEPPVAEKGKEKPPKSDSPSPTDKSLKKVEKESPITQKNAPNLADRPKKGQSRAEPSGHWIESSVGMFLRNRAATVEDKNSAGPGNSGFDFAAYGDLSFFPLVLADVGGWAEGFALTLEGSFSQTETSLTLDSTETLKTSAAIYLAGLLYRHYFDASDTGAHLAFATGFLVQDFSLPEGRFPGGVSKGLYLGLNGASPLMLGFRVFGELKYLPSLAVSGRLVELGTHLSGWGFSGELGGRYNLSSSLYAALAVNYKRYSYTFEGSTSLPDTIQYEDVTMTETALGTILSLGLAF